MVDDSMSDVIRESKRLTEAGKYDEAQASLAALAAANPDHPEVHAARAYLHAHKREYDVAAQHMDRAIAFAEAEPEYFFARGRYHLMAGHFAKAVDDASRLLELCAQYDWDYYREAAYFIRAEAYLRIGNANAAKRDCEHIRDEAVVWLGEVRSKKELVIDCEKLERS